MNLGEWLRKNNHIVKNYLLNLKASEINTKIAGVRLSSGKVELNNAIYLENKNNKAKGHYIYIFKTILAGVEYENHYIWANKKSTPIEFPACKGSWLYPGGKAVLSGDDYTYKSIQPTEQLVVTHCKVAANKSLAIQENL